MKVSIGLTTSVTVFADIWLAPCAFLVRPQKYIENAEGNNILAHVENIRSYFKDIAVLWTIAGCAQLGCAGMSPLLCSLPALDMFLRCPHWDAMANWLEASG
eukprot:5600626-Amphidinium_carterae.1